MKKSIESMFLLFVFLTVLVMSGCAPAPTPDPTSTPVPPTFTPAPTDKPTEIPTATPIPPTPIPEIVVVTAGSEWAKLNVPVGLKVITEGNITYATNLLGEKIEIERDGKTAEWLQIPLAVSMEENMANPDLYKISSYDGGPQITKMLGRLNAQPFPEGAEACKPGDVGTIYETGGFKQLIWKSNKNIPAKVLGYFTVDYHDTTTGEVRTMFGKIIEWLTDKGIIYVSSINAQESIPFGYNGIFPVGLGSHDGARSNEVQPNSKIMRGVAENDILGIWINTGCPPIDAENYYLMTGSK